MTDDVIEWARAWLDRALAPTSIVSAGVVNEFAHALLAEHDRLVACEVALASLTEAATGLCDAVDESRRRQSDLLQETIDKNNAVLAVTRRKQ